MQISKQQQTMVKNKDLFRLFQHGMKGSSATFIKRDKSNIMYIYFLYTN